MRNLLAYFLSAVMISLVILPVEPASSRGSSSSSSSSSGRSSGSSSTSSCSSGKSSGSSSTGSSSSSKSSSSTIKSAKPSSGFKSSKPVKIKKHDDDDEENVEEETSQEEETSEEAAAEEERIKRDEILLQIDRGIGPHHLRSNQFYHTTIWGESTHDGSLYSEQTLDMHSNEMALHNFPKNKVYRKNINRIPRYFLFKNEENIQLVGKNESKNYEVLKYDQMIDPNSPDLLNEIEEKIQDSGVPTGYIYQITVNNAPRHFIYDGSRSVGFVKNLSSVEEGYKVRDFEQVVQKMREEKQAEEKRQSIWKLYLITQVRLCSVFFLYPIGI